MLLYVNDTHGTLFLPFAYFSAFCNRKWTSAPLKDKLCQWCGCDGEHSSSPWKNYTQNYHLTHQSQYPVHTQTLTAETWADICTPVFTAALSWQPKPGNFSIHQWKTETQIQYIHTMTNNSAWKRKEILPQHGRTLKHYAKWKQLGVKG